MAQATADAGRYSDLQVLRSAAGWYVGTVFTDASGFPMPGSRDSGYFATREDAEGFLKAVTSLSDDDASQVLRDRP
jgi:hypothetical protein